MPLAMHPACFALDPPTSPTAPPPLLPAAPPPPPPPDGDVPPLGQRAPERTAEPKPQKQPQPQPPHRKHLPAPPAPPPSAREGGSGGDSFARVLLLAVILPALAFLSYWLLRPRLERLIRESAAAVFRKRDARRADGVETARLAAADGYYGPGPSGGGGMARDAFSRFLRGEVRGESAWFGANASDGGDGDGTGGVAPFDPFSCASQPQTPPYGTEAWQRCGSGAFQPNLAAEAEVRFCLFTSDGYPLREARTLLDLHACADGPGPPADVRELRWALARVASEALAPSGILDDFLLDPDSLRLELLPAGDSAAQHDEALLVTSATPIAAVLRAPALRVSAVSPEETAFAGADEAAFAGAGYLRRPSTLAADPTSGADQPRPRPICPAFDQHRAAFEASAAPPAPPTPLPPPRAAWTRPTAPRSPHAPQPLAQPPLAAMAAETEAAETEVAETGESVAKAAVVASGAHASGLPEGKRVVAATAAAPQTPTTLHGQPPQPRDAAAHQAVRAEPSDAELALFSPPFLPPQPPSLSVPPPPLVPPSPRALEMAISSHEQAAAPPSAGARAAASEPRAPRPPPMEDGAVRGETMARLAQLGAAAASARQQRLRSGEGENP